MIGHGEMGRVQGGKENVKQSFRVGGLRIVFAHYFNLLSCLLGVKASISFLH
jgi:hypothetical protein